MKLLQNSSYPVLEDLYYFFISKSTSKDVPTFKSNLINFSSSEKMIEKMEFQQVRTYSINWWCKEQKLEAKVLNNEKLKAEVKNH